MNSIQEQLLFLIQNDNFIQPNLRLMMEDFIEEKGNDYTFPFYQNCVEMYKAFSEEINDEIHTVGIAIEYLILALDILDDIQDGDSNHCWSVNQAQSLNGVLGIFMTSLRILRNCGFKYSEIACELLERAVYNSIEGQISDLYREFVDTDTYIEMVRLKSGSLISLSFMIGYTLATGRTNNQVNLIGEYIGIMEQIKNDIEGFISISYKNDLLNKKVTLPILYLMNKKDNMSEYLLNFYAKDELTEEEILQLKEIVKQTEPVRYCNSLRILYRNRTKELVDQFGFPERVHCYILQILK